MFLVAALAFQVGCQTETVPPLMEVGYAGKLSDEPVLVQSFSVGSVTDAALKDAIISAATRRGWEVTDLGDNRIQTQLTHRSAESTLTFEYGDSQVKIYSVSYEIDKGSERRIKRAEPDGWIRNLHKDILDLLGLLPTS